MTCDFFYGFGHPVHEAAEWRFAETVGVVFLEAFWVEHMFPEHSRGVPLFLCEGDSAGSSGGQFDGFKRLVFLRGFASVCAQGEGLEEDAEDMLLDGEVFARVVTVVGMLVWDDGWCVLE